MVADERPRLAWDRANIDYVLAQASITPQRKLDTQLYDAIAYLITLLVPPVPVATTDVQGKVELATDAETQAGTDTARAVTPSSLFAAAVAAATANRIVRRDAAGRAQVVAPSAANDIAIKSNVDAVQTRSTTTPRPPLACMALAGRRLSRRPGRRRRWMHTPR
jgi:hypothetical protein